MAETRTVGDLFSPPAAAEKSFNRHLLTVTAPNTIGNLPTVPASAVYFYVNGQLVGDGITNNGVSVTVNPSLLGMNIALTDRVKAKYTS